MHDLIMFATGAAFGTFATAGSLAYRTLTAAQNAKQANR